MAEGLREELLPAYMLLEKVLSKNVPKVRALEDNSAVIQAIRKGYSVKLRHLARTPKLSLAALNQAFTSWCALEHCPTHLQLGDAFTKVLSHLKFNPQSLGLRHWMTFKAV